MKKWCVILGLVLVVFVFGCNIKVSLNEMQVAACNSAADNNNCGKLSDLGLVTAQQCCSGLSKCCVNGATGGVVLSTLTNVQITACQSAAHNNNCGRLPDLGLVSAYECCSSSLKLCCSTSVPFADFESVVFSAVASFFTPNPVLNDNETLDLVSAYFAAGDPVDLSVVGKYSSETLSYIYAKAKGNLVPPDVSCSSAGGSCVSGNCGGYNNCSPLSGTCDSGKQCCSGTCTAKVQGRWAAQIASAKHLNVQISEGAYGVEHFSIAKGGTYYFLIDPKGFNVPWSDTAISRPVIWIVAACEVQTIPWDFHPYIHLVNRNGDELLSGELAGTGDRSAGVSYTKADYDAGNMYLLEFKELGLAGGTLNKIYWSPTW